MSPCYFFFFELNITEIFVDEVMLGILKNNRTLWSEGWGKKSGIANETRIPESIKLLN